MRTYGLIGYPLSHSFSPGYFKEKFQKEQIQADYKLFPIKDISEFPELVRKNPYLCGLNVTIPYKEAVQPYLNEIKGEAQAIKAVNTIVFKQTHSTLKLVGYNTDAYGFENTIKPYLTKHHTKALIFGTGGSSKTVSYVLHNLHIKHFFVTRRQKNNSNIITYHDLTADMVKEHKLLINTTPVGMYPEVNQKPAIPYDGINSAHLLFDLIYNPSETAFLQEGKKRNAMTENGLNMLRLQAEKSWAIWNANHS